ncbi:MAG TPA: hypothetical protein VHA78_02235 [Candidatus Peribacteraceae bacterium]|nr:hypothetical protein [Candidatus Peribacteraceae bacterium]
MIAPARPLPEESPDDDDATKRLLSYFTSSPIQTPFHPSTPTYFVEGVGEVVAENQTDFLCIVRHPSGAISHNIVSKKEYLERQEQIAAQHQEERERKERMQRRTKNAIIFGTITTVALVSYLLRNCRQEAPVPDRKPAGAQNPADR